MRSSKIKKIVERDGSSCWLCKEPIFGTSSIDHYIPRKYGGYNHVDNLRLSHTICNNLREKLFPDSFKFTVGEIFALTNRNKSTGGISKKANRALKIIGDL